MHPKFTFLVHCGAQLTAGKPKILLKTKTSAKTASLGISNNVSPRYQKNHRILVKFCDFSGTWEGGGGGGGGGSQIGYKFPPWRRTKGALEILI